MATNNFKAFALDPNANVMSQADWEALPALLSGFTAGKASSAQVNKAIRQASFIAAALAQYTANKSGQDVLDNGDLNGFITKMTTAFGKDFQALDATLTALAGLATGANKLPYFTGTDTAAQTDLTQIGRDVIGQTTVANLLTYLGLSDVLHKGNFGVGDRLQGSAAGSSHVGGFMYEPYQANNLYPLSVALMQAAGPTATEWAQLAVSYGGAFRAFLGRQTYNGNAEISELYHDQRKPSASDVGAQPVDATLTGLSGKDAAGLRTYMGLGTASTKNVGVGSGQIPDMSSFTGGNSSTAFWYKFPNGMVLMGGNAPNITGGSSGNAVFFPIPFPNACSCVIPALANSGLYGTGPVSFNVNVDNQSRFSVYTTNTASTMTIFWLAFGS